MQLPEHLHARANELLTMEQEGADRRRDWVVVLGLKPVLDGNMWRFLWGDDLQSGVAGFGETVYAAMMDFDRAMYRKANAMLTERAKPGEQPDKPEEGEKQ